MNIFIFSFVLLVILILTLIGTAIHKVMVEKSPWSKIDEATWGIGVIIGVTLILYLIFVFSPPLPSPPTFAIENPRMVLCNDTPFICMAEKVSQFEVTDEICVAWTEVNRRSSDSLSLFVYGENGEQVFVFRDEKGGTANARECKATPVENPERSGDYQTEFAANGRLAEIVGWSIVATPTPTPTPTLTPTPTPTSRSATPIAPPYSIENPRMTLCNADVNLCLVEGISQFSLTDEICAAWTEVGRSANDSLAFFVYDEEEQQVLNYVESGTDSAITRRCRVEPVDNPGISGAYQTEFTANGRPVEQIFWSISSVYHMSGEIGCIDLEPTLFFEGNVDIAINEGEFLITGEGTDYSSTDIIFVVVSGIFDGTEVFSGEIQMYHESYGENNHIEPFRVDSFDGVFQDFELYSEAQQVEAGGCDIYTRLYLEEQE